MIAGLQYGGRYLIKRWFPLKTEEFTDLCSVTNISVLIFDDSYGGYYIHGRSPYGQTESSAELLRRSLEQEARGKGQIRGLSPEEPDLQTYIIYIPKKLFLWYRQKYVQELQKSVTEAAGAVTAVQASATRYFQKEKSIPYALDIAKTKDVRRQMNELFISVIERVRNEPKKYIKERALIDQLLNRPPVNDLNSDRPVLYKDKWFSFGRFFAMGLDWDFVMLDACILAFCI